MNGVPCRAVRLGRAERLCLAIFAGPDPELGALPSLTSPSNVTSVFFFKSFLFPRKRGPQFREDVVRSVSCLNSRFSALDNHLAVKRNHWGLVKANESRPGLTEVAMIIITDTVPHVPEVVFSFKGRRSLEVASNIDLIQWDRDPFQVIRRSEELRAGDLDVTYNRIATHLPVVLLRWYRSRFRGLWRARVVRPAGWHTGIVPFRWVQGQDVSDVGFAQRSRRVVSNLVVCLRVVMA